MTIELPQILQLSLQNKISEVLWNKENLEYSRIDNIIINSCEIMRQKIEIMLFEKGKLCVQNVKLRAELCANSSKKRSHFFHFTYILLTFALKRLRTKKSPHLYTFSTF